MKETTENIFAIIFLPIFLLIIWFGLGLIINSWFSKYNWYTKIKYIHKFKIPKRFKTKVSPIYKIETSDWDGSKMVIKKWSLQYYEKDIHQILSIFLIYPTQFLSYGYQLEDSVFLCKREDVESIKGTLEENYEKIWNEKNKEYLEECIIKNKRKEHINKLNEIFTKNYE
jgi:hypothetical protein